jgi:branched-chain amino acid transport system substrate-binding protein
MVFPVRAEHREEFRVLLEYAKMHRHSPAWVSCAPIPIPGQQHLKPTCRLLCQQLGLQLTADLPFKSDESRCADRPRWPSANWKKLQGTQLVFNHGGTRRV